MSDLQVRGTSARERLVAIAWLVGVAAVALLPDPGAAIPAATYYFRDFSQTFYPLRHFQAAEIAAGRLPFWNPYVHEGEFLLPSLYPLELLHLLDSSPVFASWLLTLHLPLAALGAYCLGRDRGMSPLAAFACGSGYATGGLALSTLNLYTFLQALALAPWMVLALGRAAQSGGRWIAAAALTCALGMTTLALEIVVQGLLAGVLLAAWAHREPSEAGTPAWRRPVRLAVALALGVGLASVPIMATLGILPETVRGGGLDLEEAGGLSLPPVALAQAILPSLYMSLDRPFEAWWGHAIFVDGPPYFISIYFGVLALSVALCGAIGAQRRERAVLLLLAVFGIWYALGPAGGLWKLVHELPLADAFRTPSKSLFVTHLALALLLGRGIDELRSSLQWRRVALSGFVGAALLASAGLLAWGGGDFAAQWLRLDERARVEFAAAFPRDALLSAAIAATGSAIALAAALRAMQPRLAATLLVGLLAFDLVRAGAGINRQAPAQFFEPLPGIAAERLDQLDGGRVFALPANHSRSFRAWLDTRTRNADLWAFYALRQQLDPYNNVVDRIETAVSLDRTRFSPLLTGLGWTGRRPEQVAQLLPYLRHAGVSRIVSFDPLEHPALELRRAVPVARTGLAVHVYAVTDPLPRARIACRARFAATRAAAAHMALEPGFEAQREVALEVTPAPQAAGCGSGSAHMISATPGLERYAVDSDGAGWLVVRATHARGWQALIDGRSAGLERADGRHRAVAVPGGRHTVELRYEPPWVGQAIWLTAISAVAILALSAAGFRARRS